MNRVLTALGALALLAGVAAAAPPRVTLTAFPGVAKDFSPIALSGAISEPRAGDLVTVEGQECGVPGNVFRALAAAQTVEGGAWRTELRPRSKTVLRAVWNGATSPEVAVQVRADVRLIKKSGRTLSITANGITPMSGKKVLLQRYDRARGAWRTMRTVVIRSSYVEYGEAFVKLAVPKGTTLRAMLPLSQAKPCYLPGYSKPVRT